MSPRRRKKIRTIDDDDSSFAPPDDDDDEEDFAIGSDRVEELEHPRPPPPAPEPPVVSYCSPASSSSIVTAAAAAAALEDEFSSAPSRRREARMRRLVTQQLLPRHDEEDAAAVGQALARIAQLCSGDGREGSAQELAAAENCRWFWAVGGHAVTVMAMQKWSAAGAGAGAGAQQRRHHNNKNNDSSSYSKIQALGCNVLQQALWSWPDDSEKQQDEPHQKRNDNSSNNVQVHQEYVRAAGGTEAVVAAMRDHPSCLQVQTYGCGALVNILCDSQRNAAHFLLHHHQAEGDNINAVRHVVAAMERFPREAQLQVFACTVLKNLSGWNHRPSFRNAILDAGGAVVALGAAVEHFRGRRATRRHHGSSGSSSNGDDDDADDDAETAREILKEARTALVRLVDDEDST